ISYIAALALQNIIDGSHSIRFLDISWADGPGGLDGLSDNEDPERDPGGADARLLRAGAGMPAAAGDSVRCLLWSRDPGHDSRHVRSPLDRRGGCQARSGDSPVDGVGLDSRLRSGGINLRGSPHPGPVDGASETAPDDPGPARRDRAAARSGNRRALWDRLGRRRTHRISPHPDLVRSLLLKAMRRGQQFILVFIRDQGLSLSG